MTKLGKQATLIVGASLFAIAASGPAMASGIFKPFANQTFFCQGGNESAGNHYYFKAGSSSIERIDHRFAKGVHFQIGRGQKGSLGNNWSFETLSNVSRGKIHLYERVSLRSSSQNQHIYRTYEMYALDGKMFMILYDGVNGARDWRMKTTRKCGSLDGNKIVQGSARRYWAPSLGF